MSHQHYLARYVEFLKQKAKAKGYGFHEVWPPPQPVDGAAKYQKPSWWSLCRPKQMKKLRAERDRRLQEILQKRDGSHLQK